MTVVVGTSGVYVSSYVSSILRVMSDVTPGTDPGFAVDSGSVVDVSDARLPASLLIVKGSSKVPSSARTVYLASLARQ